MKVGLAWVVCAVLSSTGAGAGEPVVLSLSTNRAATTNFFTQHPLVLTKAQERLNASPFFKSKINDFKKRTEHSLNENLVGEEKPEAYFGAVLFHYEDGTRECYLNLMLSSTRYRDWADLGTNLLEVIIDGTTRVRATRLPTGSFFRHEVVSAETVVVVESELFPVSEELLRGLAAARRVQFRVEGDKLAVQRTLDATNLRRFKVFAETFLDGR